MITCQKCQVSNSSDVKFCQNCGVDLLPGESFNDRLVIIFGGILGFLISIGMVYFLTKYPEIAETSGCCLFTNPYVWFIGIFVFPMSALVNVIRKTPIYKRYEIRAIRHKASDPEQALMDLSEAIKLAPEKHKAALLKQRSEIHKTLGKEDDFLEDRLAFMESDGAYEGQTSFAQMFKADSDSFGSSARDSERKQLIEAGKIKAVGFCKKCQHAVELNEKSSCLTHPKSKLIRTKYVLPKDLESTLIEVEEEGAKQFKKTRRTRIIILIIVAVVIVLCVIIPMFIGGLTELFG